MLGVLLALLAATGWGLSAVFARVGLQLFRPATGTMLSVVGSFVAVAALALIVDLPALLSLTMATVIWFAIIGVVNFPMGRYFSFLGIERIGASRNGIMLASAPLFALTIAVIFTGETLTLPILAGTLLIVGGLSLVVSGQ